jgi:hypothetical protein
LSRGKVTALANRRSTVEIRTRSTRVTPDAAGCFRIAATMARRCARDGDDHAKAGTATRTAVRTTSAPNRAMTFVDIDTVSS